MRRLLVPLLLAAVYATGSAAGPLGAQDEGAPVFAVTGGMGDTQISRRNPRTLALYGTAVPLGPWELASGFSPDGKLLALRTLNAEPASIRFLDASRMRWHGPAVALPPLGTGFVRWSDRRTAVVIGERPDGLRAVVVDAERARIVRSVRIPGHLEGLNAQATPAGLAILLRGLEPRQMGPVLVGVVRRSGAVRVVEIPRIQSGYAIRSRRPALVVDPSTSRVYVFGGLDEPVADIDLPTLRVTYHTLRGLAALPSTLGTERFATLLEPGRVALGGWDESQTASLKLGLSLVDTRSWRIRRIDLDADFFARSGPLLLGLRTDRTLGVYGLDGSARFSVPDEVFELGLVSTNGRYVYAVNLAPGARASAIVVDAGADGAVSWRQVPVFGSVISPGLFVLGA